MEKQICAYLGLDNTLECSDMYNCCDCGGNECGCPYCFSCNACEVCNQPTPNE